MICRQYFRRRKKITQKGGCEENKVEHQLSIISNIYKAKNAWSNRVKNYININTDQLETNLRWDPHWEHHRLGVMTNSLRATFCFPF